MECPDCGKDIKWVIVGGGRGLLPGWGRWKCKGCSHIGIAPFEELNQAMDAQLEKERNERIAEQEKAREKFANSKDKYLNNWGKRTDYGRGPRGR